MSDIEKYWNTKILKWEESRYLRQNQIYTSLQIRQNSMKNFLEKYGVNKRILEIGAGSGYLYEQIKHIDFSHYTAVDLSERAILAFKSKLTEKDLARTTLIQSKVSEVYLKNLGDYDVIVSAGLIDWLSDEELKILSELSKTKFFLHTYSSRNLFLVSRMIHRCYLIISGFLNLNICLSKYHLDQDIINLFSSQEAVASVIKFDASSFGCAITNTNFCDQITEHFDKRAKNYKKSLNSFPWNCLKFVERKIINSIIQYIECGPVLDVGTGVGYYIDPILKNDKIKITCLDKSSEMLKCVSNKALKIQADFETEKILESYYQAVLLIGVLEFFKSPIKAIEKAIAGLKNNGLLIIYYPVDSLLGNIYKNYYRKKGIILKRIDENEIYSILRKHNMKIVKTNSIPFFSKVILVQK